MKHKTLLSIWWSFIVRIVELIILKGKNIMRYKYTLFNLAWSSWCLGKHHDCGWRCFCKHTSSMGWRVDSFQVDLTMYISLNVLNVILRFKSTTNENKLKIKLKNSLWHLKSSKKYWNIFVIMHHNINPYLNVNNNMVGIYSKIVLISVQLINWSYGLLESNI